MPAPQLPGGGLRVAGPERRTDGRGRERLAPLARLAHLVHLISAGRAAIAQQGNIAGPSAAETEIRSGGNAAQTQRAAQHVARKSFRRKTGQRGIEGKHEQPVDPQGLKPPFLDLRRGQAEGFRPAAEKIPRMRLEGDHRRKLPGRPRTGQHRADDRLVAPVDPVEIPDRGMAPAVAVTDRVDAADNPHPLGPDQSAREAAMICASPSTTRRSPTAQTQSTDARRFSGKTSRTVQVTTTSSPARTGARNLRVCPR